MASNEKKRQVDLTFLGGTAITVDKERRVIRDAGIAVKGENIEFIGKASEVRDNFQAKRSLECTDKVIIPGMVNAHVHFHHHLSKSLIPDNLGPVIWSNFVHSNVSPQISKDDEIWASQALALEMVKGGTTSFLEAGSFHPFDIIESDIQKIGIKGLIGKRAYDQVELGHSTKQMETTDEILKTQEKLLKVYANQDILVKPTVTIVGMGRFTDRLVMESKKNADNYGVVLNMHLSNHEAYVRGTQVRTGYRPVEHLEKLGILDKNLVLVHMIAVTQKEVDLLAKYDTRVVHCPSPAVKVGYHLQIGRFPEMLHAGIAVATGSDSSDVSNYQDMIRIMYLCAVLYKVFRSDAELMGAERAIEMGTINGAKAMGMEHEIGSLEVGKKADIVIFDTNRLEWRPLYDEVQALIYSANANMVETVFINGRPVIENGKVLTVDENRILAGLRERENAIKNLVNLPPTSPWKFV